MKTSLLDIIGGPDDHDSTTSQKCFEPVDLSKKIDVKQITIGIPNEYHSPMMSPEILETWQYVRKIFETAGATVKEVSFLCTEAIFVKSEKTCCTNVLSFPVLFCNSGNI